MPALTTRADRQAYRDAIRQLRDQIAELERNLRRCRRALAAERAGREALRQRCIEAEQKYDYSVGILCKKAFPED
jgi:chromosome segregation ATPase